MKFDKEFLKRILSSYITIYFTIFSLFVVESFLAFAKNEINLIEVFVLNFVAFFFLLMGLLLAILYSRKKESKEETFRETINSNQIDFCSLGRV